MTVKALSVSVWRKDLHGGLGSLNLGQLHVVVVTEVGRHGGRVVGTV